MQSYRESHSLKTASVESIAPYETEVLYENLTCLILKKRIALELAVVKIAFQLEKGTPIYNRLSQPST